ncbi:uncharacterized protein F4807DRAFT_309543 [Annulohypoxylon truncatum]|uniref:uncharacterized protein n=1 Tax=Annulohypoxylon truncatum TaxID=327061 RepID=UPI0020076E43|nr:uncharacterized protein F4807DRAFT_309543 [Annulohypoxylon truncatum]KAI1213050.1 hypothetical protein F4807DRAFT_309543 [Annulohypoxylon truncatum]
MGDQPFVTISEWQPTDGHSFSSGDSAVRREKRIARPQARSHLITSSQYGSSIEDERTPSATHDISRVSYHVKHLPEFAKTLEDSATRAFPNRGGSQRYKKVHVLLLHWTCDDLFVLKELDDLEACFREEYSFQTETFPIPSDNAHLELMLKIGAMIKEHESNDTLFIVYYGGHARIDESRQSTWCGTRSSDSPWLQWSAIQTLLERSLSDVLILLDCCAGAASATFPNGNSITETISASSWDAIAPDPGRYSFTNTLIEVLQEWRWRTFSAAMLHAEVLARLKHPRPEMLNGKHFEARATPVHFMMTANHKAPSIEITRILSSDARPPSPPQESGFDDNPMNGRSAGPQDIVGSEPNEDVPHVMISLALEEDQRLNINDWEHWLSNIPALAKYVKVQGVFKSHSTLLLLSMPVMVWDLLPENHACNFVAFIRSNNLAIRNQNEPRVVEEEVLAGADIDADLRSIYSGTTAYTAGPRESLGGARLSMMSAFSNGKTPMEPAFRGFERPSFDGSSRVYRHSSNAMPMDQSKPNRGWSTSSRGPSTRQRPAPLHKSMSYGNIAQQLAINQPRGARRTSLASISSQPELPPRVQTRLEEYFHDNPFPTVAVREFLASNLGIETSDLETWFKHRREQQEVENRLQSLKIDDHSHDPPNDGAQMILPGHLNKLLEIFPAGRGQIVVIDLRSPSEYEQSHIHGAINFRAPESFVARASMEMIERALPDEASRNAFNKWYGSTCVVFYDKVVEYTWEAPVADALYQKFKSKGWAGQCFVLKGHYREFSHSFDKYIISTNTTSNAKEYFASLEDMSEEKTQENHQQYDDWLKLLEGEDRVHSTDLVPAVKAERVDATVKHQKEIEIEFENRHPDLHKEAVNRRRDSNWSIKGPMVPHLERGIAKMQEAGRGMGMGRSAAPLGDYRRTADKLSMSDYDLLESEDEHLSHDSAPPKLSSVPSHKLASDDTAPEKKGRSGLAGGRSLLGKFMRTGRQDPPR